MSTDTDTRTDEQLAADPHAFDARLAARYTAWEQATSFRQHISDRIYRAAGYRQVWEGRHQVWTRPLSQALEDLQIMADSTSQEPEDMRRQAAARMLLAERDKAETELAQAALAVHQMEAIYRKAPWTRYFPCTNRDGHIHSSYRGCSSVQWDTAMAWRPDLSGLTIEQAVQMPPVGLGPALCSICFPAAPVELRSMTTGQVADELTKGEREAAKAARELAKAAKTLTEAEVFRTEGQHGEIVETVAKCKELVRKAIESEVELEWANLPERENDRGMTAEFLTRMRANRAEGLLADQRNAGRAASVLNAREAEHPGWGASMADVTKMQQNKYRSARKEWGLA